MLKELRSLSIKNCRNLKSISLKQTSLQPLVNLKTINLTYSRHLVITPDFTNLTLVDKLGLHGCKSLLKVHPSIGQLTNLSHLNLTYCLRLKELPETIGQLTNLSYLELFNCENLKRLPEAIKQLTALGALNLSQCSNLTRLPEQLGDMKCLKRLDASSTSIEQLPDSIAHLKKLVELNLFNCKKLRKLPDQIGHMESLELFDASQSAIEHLPDTFGGLVNLVKLNLSSCKVLTSLPNSLWKLEFLQVLNLGGCSNLEQLPEQLGKMQSLTELNASGTAIEELPDSIGQLTRLQVLNLDCCKMVGHLPSSIWNLTSLTELYLPEESINKIDLPDTVKDMKLKPLKLTCNVSLWFPLILSFSTLERLTLEYESQILSSNELYSLSKLSNLQHLTLRNWISSLPELPLNLTTLSIYDYASLEMLPDLSSLKQLKRLGIYESISLQSLPPLPPHLKVLRVDECPSLQDAPDLSNLKELEYLSFRKCSNLKSISLEQSFLQGPAFAAHMPNREIAEWFSYKSSGDTLSFTIPPELGDNFFGVAFWIVYKRYFSRVYRYRLSVAAVITNKTKDTTEDYTLGLEVIPKYGEVYSSVHCMKEHTMKSGDRIKVSFQGFPISTSFNNTLIGLGFSGRRQLQVKMCGAHLIPKRFNNRV